MLTLCCRKMLEAFGGRLNVFVVELPMVESSILLKGIWYVGRSLVLWNDTYFFNRLDQTHFGNGSTNNKPNWRNVTAEYNMFFYFIRIRICNTSWPPWWVAGFWILFLFELVLDLFRFFCNIDITLFIIFSVYCTDKLI